VEPGTRRRRDGALDELGVPLDEHAGVLGVEVVGHVERDAGRLADVPHPLGPLAADDEERAALGLASS